MSIVEQGLWNHIRVITRKMVVALLRPRLQPFAILFLALLVGLPLLTLGGVQLRQLSQNLEAFDQRHVEAASALAAQIDETLIQQERAVANLAHQLAFFPYLDEDGLAEIFRLVMSQQPGLKAITLKKGPATTPTTLSSVIQGPEGREVRIVAPVPGRQERVVAQLDLNWFSQQWKPPSNLAGAYWVLVDAERQVVAHSPDATCFEQIGFCTEPVVSQLDQSTGTIAYYSPANARDEIAGFARLPESGWGLWVASPQLAVDEQRRSILQATGLTLATGLAVAAGVGGLFGRCLTKPLFALTEGAQAVAAGNLDHRVPADHLAIPLELATVIEQFNKMTERLQQVQQIEREREAEKAKNELFAMVTHELRSPLTGIKGGITTLLRTGVTFTAEEQQQLLTDMRDETLRLEALIDQVLDLARLGSGSLPLDLELLSLEPVIEQAVELAQRRRPEHPIALAPSPQPAPLVVADRSRLGQVLANLLENAAKYSPPGSPIRVSWGADGAGWARVSVTDRGPGIPEGEEQRIFERFYRLPSGQRGTGLGLALCQGIITAHGGQIGVEPAGGPCCGSTFWFSLPGKGVKPDADDSSRG